MFFSQQPVYNHICELNKHLLNEIVTWNSVVRPDVEIWQELRLFVAQNQGFPDYV